MKCRIVSYKIKYYDSVPQQLFPWESFHWIFPEPSSGSENRTRSFTRILCPEQGTSPKLYPPTRIPVFFSCSSRDHFDTNYPLLDARAYGGAHNARRRAKYICPRTAARASRKHTKYKGIACQSARRKGEFPLNPRWLSA